MDDHAPKTMLWPWHMWRFLIVGVPPNDANMDHSSIDTNGFGFPFFRTPHLYHFIFTGVSSVWHPKLGCGWVSTASTIGKGVWTSTANYFEAIMDVNDEVFMADLRHGSPPRQRDRPLSLALNFLARWIGKMLVNHGISGFQILRQPHILGLFLSFNMSSELPHIGDIWGLKPDCCNALQKLSHGSVNFLARNHGRKSYPLVI